MPKLGPPTYRGIPTTPLKGDLIEYREVGNKLTIVRNGETLRFGDFQSITVKAPYPDDIVLIVGIWFGLRAYRISAPERDSVIEYELRAMDEKEGEPDAVISPHDPSLTSGAVVKAEQT